MLKWMIRRKLRAFEREHGYDASYLHELLDTDLGAFLKLGLAAGQTVTPRQMVAGAA